MDKKTLEDLINMIAEEHLRRIEDAAKEVEAFKRRIEDIRQQALDTMSALEDLKANNVVLIAKARTLGRYGEIKVHMNNNKSEGRLTMEVNEVQEYRVVASRHYVLPADDYEVMVVIRRKGGGDRARGEA